MRGPSQGRDEGDDPMHPPGWIGVGPLSHVRRRLGAARLLRPRLLIRVSGVRPVGLCARTLLASALLLVTLAPRAAEPFPIQIRSPRPGDVAVGRTEIVV